MKTLEIVKGEDHPILRAMSKEVHKIDGKLKKFVKQMKEAMIAAKGIGIAAPQVGENIRVFLTTLNLGTPQERTIEMINPEIVERSKETEIGEEGCLSLPGLYGDVARSREITVKFWDLSGQERILRLEGLNARVVQHENDHLDGILFVDKLEGELVKK